MTPLAGAIERVWPTTQWRDVHFLLAVSGGADSVTLLRTMIALKQLHGGLGEIHVAHLNHRARGGESDADQLWVAELCERLGVRFWTDRVEIPASETKEGWEAAARDVRYNFLTQTAEQLGARFIATAHTADDQVETIFHRILRGTGMEGLTGIPFTRPLTPSVTLVRPMLEVTRAEVIACLNDFRQDFRTDSTNLSSQFTRNWIRNELLPSIRERVNPDVDQALLRLAQQAAEQRAEIAPHAGRLLAECVQFAENQISISTPPLAGERASMLRELCRRAWKQAGWPLRDMGFEQWKQLAVMLVSPKAQALTLPHTVRVVARNGLLVLTKVAS